MTLPDDVKQPLLRSFHEKTVTPGWTFDGCGPNEKDRQLLVEYDQVVYELNLLEPQFLEVIVDICRKMATGMADYAHHAHVAGVLGLDTREDFDLYCHYVAGLVGEGLSRLYAASGKEAPHVGDQLALSNAMGLMLQKTNILRDFREDVDAGRLFWPREIWHDEYGFKNPQDMYATNPDSERRALWALSAVTVDTLRHATDSLDYLAMLKNQTVFNFCAIPQTMAIATLALCFMNPQVFHCNVKIRKAEAASVRSIFIHVCLTPGYLTANMLGVYSSSCAQPILEMLHIFSVIMRALSTPKPFPPTLTSFESLLHVAWYVLIITSQTYVRS